MRRSRKPLWAFSRPSRVRIPPPPLEVAKGPEAGARFADPGTPSDIALPAPRGPKAGANWRLSPNVADRTPIAFLTAGPELPPQRFCFHAKAAVGDNRASTHIGNQCESARKP